MTPQASNPSAKFRRIEARELKRLLETDPPPLVLDVRRAAAFGERRGIPGAVPFALDRDPLRLPIVARDHPLVPY